VVESQFVLRLALRCLHYGGEGRFLL